MTSFYIVRYGPCYKQKIKVLPTSYSMDCGNEANREAALLTGAATDLCKYYVVVAKSSEEAENVVKEKISVNS